MQLPRMSTLVATYQQVQSRIHRACEQTGRPRSEVKLLAVSKTKPATMVKEIYDQGQRSFGENYLQDALDKIEALTELTDIEWHFIGPIQSNKTRPIAENFQWVETLEREKIAQRLNEQRPAELPPLNVLIQVNISGEAQKSGLKSEEVADFADLIATLPNLTLRGLMCIPEATEDEQKLAQQFDNMHKLLQSLQNKHPQCDTLSMGMSADLELAVKHHTTQVRIGTDIFGARA